MELILAALTAGAVSGVAGTATNAINDAYITLKSLLARRLARGGTPPDILEEAGSDDSGRLEQALMEVGADSDEDVLAAAQRVLEAVDSEAPSYTVNIDDNYGAAGTFTAPVSISNVFPSSPPSQPGNE